MNNSLQGKVALVTGASRGVGKGIALGLGEAGATVYITGRTVVDGQAVVNLPGTIYQTEDGNMLPAKEPPYDPEDDGVPPEMMDGVVNEDGWVKWQMLPTTLTEADVIALEQEYGTRFPPLFRAYLVSHFHLINQINNGKISVLWPELTSDNPFGHLRLTLNGWKLLLSAGYIPFAGYEDDWGPVCFDTEQKLPDGDCAIIWFDHEVLYNLPQEELMAHRQEIQPYAQFLYGSFRELMTELFLMDYK